MFERGAGRLRRDELRHSRTPLAMGLMQLIKQAFDPILVATPDKQV